MGLAPERQLGYFPSVSDSSPAQKFDGLLKQVLTVPKVEIDRREAEYQKRRKELRKKSK
jgi:hypothetical protein